MVRLSQVSSPLSFVTATDPRHFSFNCLLPAFTCGQYAECNSFNGQCSCPDGFGGVDCIEPRTYTHIPRFKCYAFLIR